MSDANTPAKPMIPTASVSPDSALRLAGLRPTRQRLELYKLLFTGEDCHVTPECLYAEARKAGASVSVATIYNTLNQFTESGLLRRLTIDQGRTFYDTNTTSHHHVYNEETGELFDLPESQIECLGIPEAPPGREIQSVEIIVRVR